MVANCNFAYERLQFALLSFYILLIIKVLVVGLAFACLYEETRAGVAVMKSTTSIYHDALVITLSGELDALAVQKLEPMMESLPGQYRNILLDLRDITFIDSTGIGAIVFIFKRLQGHDAVLRLVCGDGQPRDLLMLLRIDRTIPCLRTLEEYLLVRGSDDEQDPPSTEA